MVSTRTSRGPGGGTISSRSVAVRTAVNQRALTFSSSPIRDAIGVFDASAEDQIHPVGLHRRVGEGEGPGQVADTEVADGFYALTQDLGRHAHGEPVDQPGLEEACDLGCSSLDHHRPDTECYQLAQQRREIHATVAVGTQIHDRGAQ